MEYRNISAFQPFSYSASFICRRSEIINHSKDFFNQCFYFTVYVFFIFHCAVRRAAYPAPPEKLGRGISRLWRALSTGNHFVISFKRLSQPAFCVGFGTERGRLKDYQIGAREAPCNENSIHKAI
jgi:hypothetical protein